MTRELTASQLARLGRAAARAWLDLRAGIPVTEPERLLVAENARAHPDNDVRPVRYADMGPAVLVRLGHERAGLFVALTTDDGRELLAARLHRSPSGWRLEEAELLAARDVPDPPAPDGAERAANPGVPRHFTGVLGPPPQDESAWERWIASAAVIDVYREWNDVTDTELALGPSPDDVTAARERERAVAYIRAQLDAVGRPVEDEVPRPSRDTERGL